MRIGQTIAAILGIALVVAYFWRSPEQTVTIETGSGNAKVITLHNAESYRIGKGEGFVQRVEVDMSAKGGSDTDVTITINGEKVN